MIAVMDQAGLGLPDRDYYLKTDEKSVDLRNKYVAHVQTVFAFLGCTRGRGAEKTPPPCWRSKRSWQRVHWIESRDAIRRRYITR